MKSRSLVVMFVFMSYLLIISWIPTSLTTDTDYSAPYSSGNGPSIDGTIVASEWANGLNYTVSFQFNDTENPSIEVTLFLLHNGSAVFIGLNMTTLDNYSDPTDAFVIYFDEENNGELAGNGTLPREDGLKLSRDGNITDLSYNGSEWIDESNYGNLTQGPSYGATNGIGQWEFIFISSYDPVNRIYTNSSDFDVDLPSIVLEYAAEIGFDIEYYDADIDATDSFTTTQNGTVSEDPTLWDVLVCEKVPPSPLNMTKLWLYIILGMIIPAAFLVFMIYLIKQREVTG
jgi:hypothetical protein